MVIVMKIINILTFVEKECREIIQNSLLVVVFLTPILIPMFLGREILSKDLNLNISMWNCFAATMAGTSIISIIIAEEKEKKILKMIMRTPVKKSELLIGKLAFGFLTTFLTCLIVTFVVAREFSSNFAFYLILAIGSLCFTSIGILIGMVAPNQTAAEVIISPTFIILLLPSFLVGVSSVVDNIAKALPSYYIFNGIKAALENNFSKAYSYSLITLVYSVAIFILCYWILKRIKLK